MNDPSLLDPSEYLADPRSAYLSERKWSGNQYIVRSPGTKAQAYISFCRCSTSLMPSRVFSAFLGILYQNLSYNHYVTCKKKKTAMLSREESVLHQGKTYIILFLKMDSTLLFLLGEPLTSRSTYFISG